MTSLVSVTWKSYLMATNNYLFSAFLSHQMVDKKINLLLTFKGFWIEWCAFKALLSADCMFAGVYDDDNVHSADVSGEHHPLHLWISDQILVCQHQSPATPAGGILVRQVPSLLSPHPACPAPHSSSGWYLQLQEERNSRISSPASPGLPWPILKLQNSVPEADALPTNHDLCVHRHNHLQ